MKWLLLAAKLALAAAVLWLVWDKFDADQFRLVLGDPWLALVIPVAWLLNQVLTTLRLHALLRALQRPVSAGGVFRAAMASLFVGNLMPGVIGADVVKFFYLHKSDPGMSRGELAIVVGFDRVLGLFAVVFWCALFGAWVAVFQRDLVPDRLLLLQYMPAALLVAMVAGLLLLDTLVRLAGRLPLPGMVRQMNAAYARFRSGGSPRAVAAVLAYNLAAVFVLLSGLVIVGARLLANESGAGLVALQYFLVPLVLIAAMLPLTPMGIGVAQIGMAGAYALYGLEASVGVAISSLSQLGLLLVSLAVGGLMFLLGVRPTGDPGSGDPASA